MVIFPLAPDQTIAQISYENKMIRIAKSFGTRGRQRQIYKHPIVPAVGL